MSTYFVPVAILATLFMCSCEKSEDDCGAEKKEGIELKPNQLFAQPSEIYWGVTGNTRSYSYNWTFAGNCTKKNPKVSFVAVLTESNNTLSNPFSFKAATQTCLGVQPQQSVLLAASNQMHYESEESEIGMQQCFSGQSTATIYPYLSLSLNTLGSSQADSLYLVNHIDYIRANRIYNEPK